MNIIEVNDLQKAYDALQAVSGVTFSVSTGEVFGILGPNGAGKTTTVEILEGMRRPDNGRVIINNIDVSQNPNAVKYITGVQLQSSHFFDNLKLTEILDLLSNIYGLSTNSIELLEKVELEDKASSYFEKLLGGQKQRFAIAAALVNDPLILFLDEPTTGLALSDVHQLIGVLLRLRRNGHTVIVIEHHLDVIKCADWIIDLGPEGGELGGEVVAAGTPDEVAREPGSYTGQHLIGMF